MTTEPSAPISTPKTLDVLAARLAEGTYDKGAITDGFLHGKPKAEDWQCALPVFMPPHVMVSEAEGFLEKPPLFDKDILAMYKKYLEGLHATGTGYDARRAPHKITGLHFSPEDDLRRFSLDDRLSRHDIVTVLDFLAVHPQPLVTVLGLHSFLDDYVQRLSSAVRKRSWLGLLMPKPLGDAFRSLNGVVPRNEQLFAGTFTFHLVLSHIHFSKTEGRVPGDLTESDITRFMAKAGIEMFEGNKKCPFGMMFRRVAEIMTRRQRAQPGARLWLMHQQCLTHGAALAESLKPFLREVAAHTREKYGMTKKPQTARDYVLA